MSAELVERCREWLVARRMPMIVLGHDCNMAESLGAFVQAEIAALSERVKRAEGERDAATERAEEIRLTLTEEVHRQIDALRRAYARAERAEALFCEWLCRPDIPTIGHHRACPRAALAAGEGRAE